MKTFNDNNGIVLIGESFGGLMSAYITARLNNGGNDYWFLKLLKIIICFNNRYNK